MSEISLGFTSAFTLGLLHSLEPSHAKAVLAAYFLNRRRTVMEAVFFAITVTVAHTLMIYLLALGGYALGPFWSHSVFKSWSEWIGGILMMGIGGWMFWNERKAGFHKKKGDGVDDSGGHFFHHHDDHHDHGTPSSLRQIFLLGFCSGAIPCMSGLAVLVFAWTTVSPVQGLALVAVFSAGLGLVVLAMCIAMQQAARAMDIYWKNSARWTRFLPVVSSIMIMLIGIFVVFQKLLR